MLSMATSAAVTIMTIFMMLIPLCWTPGRADRVTPLFRFVCARRPLLPSHVPAQSPGEMAPEYLSLWRWQWFKYDWENREGHRLTKWSHASMVGSGAEVPVHCHHSFTRLQPARIYLPPTRRMCSSSSQRTSAKQITTWYSRRRQSNPSARQRDYEVVELGTARVSAFWAEHLSI